MHVAVHPCPPWVTLARQISLLGRLLRYADEFAAVFNRDQKYVPDHNLKTIAHLHVLMVENDICMMYIQNKVRRTDRQTGRQTDRKTQGGMEDARAARLP